MKKLLSVLIIAAFILFASNFVFSIVQVGEEVAQWFETPHPYAKARGVVWEKEFHWPNAGYIAIHFSEFNLAKGDYVEISSPDGKFYYTFSEKGKKVKHKDGTESISTFWATHIPGDRAIVRLVSKSEKSDHGFVIDKWARGYEKGYIEAAMTGLEEETMSEAICNSDDKEWAKCYEGTEMYNKARAVCRLLINGTGACTGWLLGSEGHIMTNNHCISTQSSASNTDYEFMAEGATCSTSCASWGACPGTVEASSGTLIKNDYNLDYSLILLPTNITGTYGYLQFRCTLPTMDERIYIPQHPGAWGKQLAVNSDTDGPVARIFSTNATPCYGGPGDIGYYADTAGGSSGSPVLGYGDNLVVALHHCANCPNRGVPIPSIIIDLGTSIPDDAIGGSPCVPEAPSNLQATAVSPTQINLSWQDNSDNETEFRIWRRTGTSGPFSWIATMAADIEFFPDTGLSPNTTYQYAVHAHNDFGNSPDSNVAQATTPDTIPAAPSNLQASPVSSTQINLSWSDNSNNEFGFKIERKIGSSGTYSQIATVGASTTTYQDTGLTPNTTYYYKVRAYNAIGNSPYSNEANAATPDTIPAAPSNLQASPVSSTQINLSWSDNSNNETGFKIERKIGSSGTYSQIATVGANTTTYQDTGLTPNTTYYYKIRAYNVVGDSPYSNEANAATPAAIPVADFTASSTNITVGDSVDFTDQSLNSPTSWDWTFEGGTPGTSTVQNPTVTYNTLGTFTVTLTASNAQGSDTETKVDYITVSEKTYCASSANNQSMEYIAGVEVGDLNNPSGPSPYSDFTSLVAHLPQGGTVNVSLTPGFPGSSFTENWKIWIDYNGDHDFEDAGEEVFSGSGSSTVSGSFTVPPSASGTTRMRVSMAWGSYPPYCGTFTYGEVEDYTVNIENIIPAEPDFNNDGRADIVWRYYGTGGYNAVWLRGTATMAASVTGISPEKIKNNPGVVDMGNLKPIEETGEVAAKVDTGMSLSIQELRKLGIKDGFEEYKIAEVDKSKPLIDPFDFYMKKSKPGEAVSHIMEAIVSDPRDDPEAVNLPTAANTDWKLCGSGDFNDDDKVDLVWRNISDGRNLVWYMNGLTLTDTGQLPQAVNLDWTLCGTGDFNNDDKMDLVWRNISDGRNLVWYMNGLTLIETGWLPTTVNLDWALCGSGDFNSDGNVDLVWRNMSDGRNLVWYLDGVTLTGTEFLPGAVNMDWTLCGSGDFNNDGKVDLLWRNLNSGGNLIWYLDGVTLTGTESLTTVTNTTWKIEN